MVLKSFMFGQFYGAMRHLYFLTILLAMFSCDNKSRNKGLVEYSEGRQLLTVNNISKDGSDFNEPQIGKIIQDSVLIGEELLVKIFLTDTDLKIVDAFVDCDNVENPSVDTVTYKVSGCKNGLAVKADTILIAFRPTSPGLKIFSTLTILTMDKEKVFRTQKYSFDYKVVEN